MYFRYFVIISPWKRAWPFIWTNFNSHYPWMRCAKIGWHSPSCSWEKVQNRKSLQTDDRRTNGRTDRQTTEDRRSEKLTWAISSGELRRVDNPVRIKEIKQRIIFKNIMQSWSLSFLVLRRFTFTWLIWQNVLHCSIARPLSSGQSWSTHCTINSCLEN